MNVVHRTNRSFGPTRLDAMDVMLTIGEFSKMTYLSVKALRHYHDVGLLVPVAVDQATGYRRYTSGQVSTAQAIRRFRDLDMPLDDVRAVLTAPGDAARNAVILRHLDRMHQQLERTQLSVASLHALLEADPPQRTTIEYRRIPPLTVVAASASVGFDDCGDWLEPALADLHDEIARRGLTASGPDGALYPDEFFEAGIGEITAFVPVAAPGQGTVSLPAITVAVLTHNGPPDQLDQAYAALGTAVAERGIGGPGPIREHYLNPLSTDVCWPITGAQS